MIPIRCFGTALRATPVVGPFIALAVLAGASLVASVVGCEPLTTRPSPRTSLLEGAVVTVPYRSPAVWRYHPRNHGELLSRRDLAGGATLYSSRRGERWLAADLGKSISVADTLAPEPLLASFSSPIGHWVFVGESGTTYESESPLGPFIRSSPPIEPLRRVAAAGRDIVGIRRDGTLVHSADAGTSWEPVGPARQFVDLALGREGAGLALAAPEQLYESRDGGGTWTLVDVPAQGALGFSSSDPIELETALGVVRYDLTLRRLVPALRRVETPPRVLLPANLPLGPSARALVERSATIWGDRYFELSPVPNEDKRWEVLSGVGGGALSRVRVPALDGCQWVVLSASASELAAACGKREADATGSVPIEFLFSRDHGKSWNGQELGVYGRRAQLQLALSDAGRLFVTGICPAKRSESGCVPSGVHALDVGAAHASITDAKTPLPAFEALSLPALAATALALVPAANGSSVEVLGRRTKSDRLVLYTPITSVAASGFEAREIEGIPASWTSDVQVESLARADDGSLSLVLRNDGRGNAVALLGDEGQLVSFAIGPERRSQIAAFGSFALALDLSSRELWESTNAGVSWEPLGAVPVPLCPPGNDEPRREGGVLLRAEPGDCQVALACAATGCTIGDTLSRVGWRGQEATLGTIAPSQAGMSGALTRQVKAPLACTAEEVTWTPLLGLISIPSAEQAAIADLAWFGVTLDYDQASAAMVHARRGPMSKLEVVELFPPAARPASFAIDATVQVEGGAAVRYVVPDEGVPAELVNVDVAWENLLEKRRAQGRIAAAGRFTSGDSAATNDAARRADPALVSVASGGIHVRPHHGRARQSTYFLDGKSVTTLSAPPWPPDSMSGRDEMLRVGQESLFVRFLPNGAGMLRAVQRGASWEFSAMTVAAAAPERFGLSQSFGLAYVGSSAALQLVTGSAEGATSEAWTFPVRASGNVFAAPLPVPTQADLPPIPEPCNEHEIQGTPRTVVAHTPGTRHPVVISAGVEPLRVLLTDTAVLHGTPERPCARVLDGGLLRRGGASSANAEERILVDLDDMAHSWHFRVVRAERPVVEYRRMSCQFEPTMPVPDEVYVHPGTLVRRAK